MHIAEDDLLKFALETCDDLEAQAISEHLAACDTCRERLAHLRGDIAAIAGVRPKMECIPLPFHARRPSAWKAVARMAAVLLIGFVSGVAVAHWACRCPATVVPQYSAITAGAMAETTPAPPVDLANNSH